MRSTESKTKAISQTDVDALWLACRVHIDFGGVPRDLRGRAQLRLQRLVSAGLVSHLPGKYPTIIVSKTDAD